jgi:hypothetical protein
MAEGTDDSTPAAEPEATSGETEVPAEQPEPIEILPEGPEQLEYRTGAERGPVLFRQEDEGGHGKQQSDDH